MNDHPTNHVTEPKRLKKGRCHNDLLKVILNYLKIAFGSNAPKKKNIGNSYKQVNMHCITDVFATSHTSSQNSCKQCVNQ